ncbi:2-C-methyl-D-erythritol 4-phosphate cytidylyltransferase [Caldisalinibacter kiritimatiensis]|uniref:2-C-methyl-D-erythritol 4-phosphate cytidylyltransferase n=1 Tax=Caldisalinibacter kiritimatiensis TaxID=1304284 RepID=R1ATT7_9FIRM|nr:2-C-methyl-D-erythritol 4-phosphate cytidylyltransferase [Caldisalinibacter kiritimatiensis]EOD00067.1 2-C-methyl-D-erythritol 4-phosphate cytidylyltransferase [Caldisalinibacter kiritimatiensis]
MSYENKYVSVVIPAAGMGKRMKSTINKQYIILKDKPVLAHTIERFDKCQYIDEIVLVVREDEIDYCRENIVKKYNFQKIKSIVAGGKERQDSVYNGLFAVNDKCQIVLVHDGARPFVTEKNIVDGIEGVIKHKACVIGVPVKDTIKVIDQSNSIIDTPNRSTLWSVQTPQCFEYDILLKAYEKAKQESYTATDDSMLVENLGYKVKMIMGSYKNIKLTTPEDLEFGLVILKEVK